MITGKLNLKVNLEAYSALSDTVTVTLRSTTTAYPAVSVASGDDIVDLADLAIMDNDVLNFVSGLYIITDLNGDDFVDINAMAYVDNNAFNIVSNEMPNLRPVDNKSNVKKDNASQKEKQKT